LRTSSQKYQVPRFATFFYSLTILQKELFGKIATNIVYQSFSIKQHFIDEHFKENKLSQQVEEQFLKFHHRILLSWLTSARYVCKNNQLRVANWQDRE
jgi:hypothetical protein